MRKIYPDSSAIMAPVAGHTDLPFRRSIRRHSCRFAFTEMIDAGSLVFGNAKTLHLAERGKDEDFLGIQLVGSDPATLEKASEMVNDVDFDVLDFNLGCPAPKVARKCEGITFAMKKPDEALRMTELLVKTSRIPVSVKTRILSPDDPAPTVEFCRRLADAGVSAITIHGRMKDAFYSGPVAYGVIKAVRESVDVQVIANGGAMTGKTYRELLEKTSCSCGMIARGALGNPWIFRNVNSPGKTEVPTLDEFATELDVHVRDMISFYGEEMAMKVARKTILAYLKGRGFPSALRASVSFLATESDFASFMDKVCQGPSERYFENVAGREDEFDRLLLR